MNYQTSFGYKFRSTNSWYTIRLFRVEFMNAPKRNLLKHDNQISRCRSSQIINYYSEPTWLLQQCVGWAACQLDSSSSVGSERGSTAHIRDTAFRAYYRRACNDFRVYRLRKHHFNCYKTISTLVHHTIELCTSVQFDVLDSTAASLSLCLLSTTG